MFAQILVNSKQILGVSAMIKRSVKAKPGQLRRGSLHGIGLNYLLHSRRSHVQLRYREDHLVLCKSLDLTRGIFGTVPLHRLFASYVSRQAPSIAWAPALLGARRIADGAEGRSSLNWCQHVWKICNSASLGMTSMRVLMASAD